MQSAQGRPQGLGPKSAFCPGRKFSFIYKDDGQGASSANTGFFVHFRQGFLDSGEFSVDLPTPNQQISVDARGVNNTDVWLYQLNSDGLPSTLWTKLDSMVGNNIIYNSLKYFLENKFDVMQNYAPRVKSRVRQAGKI